MNRRNVINCLTALFLAAAGAQAGTVSYSFSVDTSGIAALSPAGGWLDFEFNQANAFDALSGVATVNAFSSVNYLFGPTEWPSLGVTGSLPGPIDIPNDQGGANSFLQEVTSWGDSFRFSVTLSGPAVGTPAGDGSAFFVALLAPDYSPIVAPLTGAGEILDVTIDTSGGTSAEGSVFTGGSATVVPEPGAAGLVFIGIALVGIALRRKAAVSRN